jgi:ribosomal-protein-alanine N-acetyltransferase
MTIIRAMQQEDVEGVMAIEEEVVEFPWTANIFRDCIKVGYSCWVIDDGGQIVGYGLLSLSDVEAHILNICITGSRQQQGLGLSLMKHLIEKSKELQADSVFLEVRVSNKRAFRLYKNLGFKIIGRRKDYYPATHGREDALVLELRFQLERGS